MRVLVACEFSGRVRSALRALGVEAWSNDFREAEDGGPHIQGDVREALRQDWDGLIAFPDCTHHVVSGARWFHETPKRPRAGVAYEADRYAARERDRAFVRLLWESGIPRIAIENPIGTLGEILGPPTQIVHPYWFGDEAIKSTCLWLQWLPPLHASDWREPPQASSQRRLWQECWTEAPSPERQKNRSRTYPGLAAAMAAQWAPLFLDRHERTA